MVRTAEIENARGVSAADGSTKARIERAALNLFAESGVDMVTTREIAADAGISEGALYRYFRGKEQLAEALYFTIHERLADLIDEAAAKETDIESQARAIVEGYCQVADDDWALFCYHLLATHRFLPYANRKLPNEKNPVASAEKVIAKAMQRGELAKADPAFVTAMALGVVLQAALHKAYGRMTGDLSAQSPALAKAVVSLLKSL